MSNEARDNQMELRLGPGQCSSLAQGLQCESSEDGDGAEALVSTLRKSGRMPVPWQFAVPRRPAVRIPVMRGENRHGE